MGINKNEFWGTNYYNHPPLTGEILESAEKILGVKLPSRLIELLKIQNGGYTNGFAFPIKQKTTWADSHVPLSELFGIVPDKNIRTVQNIMIDYIPKEWGLPEKQVLLTGDGHWWITLDYRTSNNPSVKWIDVECEEEVKVADTFDQFIEGLVSDETFE